MFPEATATSPAPTAIPPDLTAMFLVLTATSPTTTRQADGLETTGGVTKSYPGILLTSDH
jgi:hypothetical protein